MLNHWEKGNKISTLNMERGFLLRPPRPLFQREEDSNLSYANREIRKVRTWAKWLITRGTCALPKPIFLGIPKRRKFEPLLCLQGEEGSNMDETVNNEGPAACLNQYSSYSWD
ncbi:hypothetical protein EV1_004527 [Malus domestica]